MTMNSLSIDDFDLVLRLADSLSVAAVARARNGPSSQVSRALTRIEAAAGARLFHRSTHGLSLTDEGRLFAGHARQMVDAAGALGEDLARRHEGASGLLRLSVPAILAERVLMPALSGLTTAHPSLQVALNITDRVVELATEGIDIAIRAGVPPRDTVVARSLGRHRRRLYAAPAYLQAFGMPQDLAALAAHRLISNGAVARQNQWQFLRDGQPLTLAVKGQVQADNTAAVMSLALAGLGIARLNDVVAAPLVAAGALVPVLDDIADPGWHEIHALALFARQRSPRIRLAMDWLVSCFAAFRPD